jgi:hypothetical protein
MTNPILVGIDKFFFDNFNYFVKIYCVFYPATFILFLFVTKMIFQKYIEFDNLPQFPLTAKLLLAIRPFILLIDLFECCYAKNLLIGWFESCCAQKNSVKFEN